jgi:hypothetical protein
MTFLTATLAGIALYAALRALRPRVIGFVDRRFSEANHERCGDEADASGAVGSSIHNGEIK